MTFKSNRNFQTASLGHRGTAFSAFGHIRLSSRQDVTHQIPLSVLQLYSSFELLDRAYHK